MLVVLAGQAGPAYADVLAALYWFKVLPCFLNRIYGGEFQPVANGTRHIKMVCFNRIH